MVRGDVGFMVSRLFFGLVPRSSRAARRQTGRGGGLARRV